jgi:hypothetical protein
MSQIQCMHSELRSTAQLGLDRDMILHVPLLSDLALIRNRSQVIIDEQYRCESPKSYSF